MASACFPYLVDGNVEFHFSKKDQKWLLRCEQLTMHSGWFQQALSEWWKFGDESSILNGKNHWVFELKFEKGEEDGSLWQKCDRNQTKTEDLEMIGAIEEKFPAGTDPATIQLHEKRVRCVKAHQKMLSAIYHKPPTFSHSSLDSAIASILDLAKLGDYYVCEDIINYNIGRHLSDHRDDVYDRCASTPVPMLELAMATKQPLIFMEATTNLLGRCQQEFEGMLPELSDMGIAELMKTKRAEFTRVLQQCENPLFKIHYDAVQPINSGYLALAYFRDWFAHQLNSGTGSGLGPGYAVVYRSMQSYLTYPDQQAHWTGVAGFLTSIYAPNMDADINNLMHQLNRVFLEANRIIAPLWKTRQSAVAPTSSSTPISPSWESKTRSYLG